MSRITISFPSILLPFALLACSQGGDGLFKRERLKGSVRQVTISNYYAAEKFGELQKDGLYSRMVNKFDESGRRQESNIYSHDGRLMFRNLYKYSDAGDLIEQNRYQSNGELFHRYTYKTDLKARTIEIKTYYPDGKLFEAELERYDEEDCILEQVQFNLDGTIDTKTIFKYDDKVTEYVERNSFNAQGGLKYTSTFEYSAFDKRGNWQRQIQRSALGHRIVEREIEYY